MWCRSDLRTVKALLAMLVLLIFSSAASAQCRRDNEHRYIKDNREPCGHVVSDGKGQPSQSNAVSHGCPPARFRKVNVINTGRAS